MLRMRTPPSSDPESRQHTCDAAARDCTLGPPAPAAAPPRFPARRRCAQAAQAWTSAVGKELSGRRIGRRQASNRQAPTSLRASLMARDFLMWLRRSAQLEYSCSTEPRLCGWGRGDWVRRRQMGKGRSFARQARISLGAHLADVCQRPADIVGNLWLSGVVVMGG